MATNLSDIGIELLINPKKRGGASDADSIVSAISATRSAKSGMSSGNYGSGSRAPSVSSHGAAGAFDNFGGVPGHPPAYAPQHATPPQQHAPHHSYRMQQRAHHGVDAGAGSGSGGSEESSSSEEDAESEYASSEQSYGSSALSGDAAAPRRRAAEMDPAAREQDEIREKRELLYQFDRLQKKGVRVPHAFSMSSSLEEMRAELNRIKTDKEVDASIRFQRRMLMACVTGIEFMNSKFDPFDVKLEGWSDSINENIDDYDDVFEELYTKYRGKAKMAPEIKLLFMVGGSAVMFHLTNSMLKNMMPGLDHAQFSRAAMQTMMGGAGRANGQQQQQPRQQPAAQGGLGMLGSLFGSLFGGGAGGGGGAPRAPPQQQPPAPPPSAPRQMRGPVAVDDILSELQQSAFASAPHAKNVSSRIEVLSNASDSDISEILQDAAGMHVPGKARFK